MVSKSAVCQRFGADVVAHTSPTKVNSQSTPAKKLKVTLQMAYLVSVTLDLYGPFVSVCLRLVTHCKRHLLRLLIVHLLMTIPVFQITDFL